MDKGKHAEDTGSGLEVLQKAGMDWEVLKRPVTVDGVEFKGQYATKRSDNGGLLGIVGENYRILQNRTLASLVDRTFGDAVIEKQAGMFSNGARVYIQAKLAGGLSVGAGDDIEKYLLFTTTHDGSAALQIFLTPIRISCRNSLMFAIRSAMQAENSHMQSIRHTKSMSIQIGKAQENLAFVSQRFGVFQDQARAMLKTPLSQDGLAEYLKRIDLIPAKGELSGKSKSILEQVSSLFEHGKGQELQGVRGTLWAGLNAVTEYVQYERTTRDDKREESATFGSGAQVKRAAWETALEMVA